MQLDCNIIIKPNNNPMKFLYIFILFFLSFCIYCNNGWAQPGGKMIKQPPRITGVLNATNSATAKVKIHANSNTVVGINKTHPNYGKKNKKQGEIKEEKEIEAVTSKKEKNRK